MKRYNWAPGGMDEWANGDYVEWGDYAQSEFARKMLKEDWATLLHRLQLVSDFCMKSVGESIWPDEIIKICRGEDKLPI